MPDTIDTADYILGHTKEELERLTHQGQFFEKETEEILREGGLRPGMRVLDVGCGTGDVSMIAGRLVGRDGSVLGIDRSEAALDVAGRRARSAGLDHVGFACKDIFAVDNERFDAVIGRFVLLHFSAPQEVIRHAATLVARGGILAFAEMDIRSTSMTPALPLLKQCIGWITALYEKAGLEPDMGSRLHQCFRAAGLRPSLTAKCRIEGGSSSAGLRYVTDTLRSMMPMLAKFGIVDHEDLDIESLQERLQRQSTGDQCIIYPRLIGAWALAHPSG